MNNLHLPIRYVGKPLIHHHSVDSTNRMAQQLIQDQQASHGAVIHADEQTAGRGQQCNQWESAPAQNLTFSLTLFPRLSVDQQHWLTVATALSLCDTLDEWLTTSVMIKWPNDILCESSKICGILIQNNLKGRMIHSTVIGVGLNVNQDEFAVNRATSLALLTGRYWDRQEVFTSLLTRLEQRLDQLADQAVNTLKKDYLSRMFWRGELRRFADQHGDFYGTIVGIDEQGRLAVEVDGQIRYYDNKELVYQF